MSGSNVRNARGLVTTGIYRYIRHPQYTGIFCFTLGWVVHWPSYVTLVLWPILLTAYVWLAKQEEQQVIQEFGEQYLTYTRKTRRFIPFLL